MKLQNQPKTNSIEEFISLFRQGYEAWVNAGEIVAHAMDEDADFAEKVHEKYPEISVDTILAFERLGRKELYPKLLISDSPGAKRLRRMPYSIQKKYAEEPLPLLIKTEKGWETLNVNVFNLTSGQAAQVFNGDGIRGEAAQRAYIEDSAATSLVQVDDPYRIVGRKLIIMQKCQLTAKQLAHILADMET